MQSLKILYLAWYGKDKTQQKILQLCHNLRVEIFFTENFLHDILLILYINTRWSNIYIYTESEKVCSFMGSIV